MLEFLSFLPSSAELATAVPVILSLVMIEGLLSVDNAMGIAAMAADLPKEQQKKALRYGIIGAYAFRGLTLGLVAWIAGNPWIKGFGAVYLLYLMSSSLVEEKHDETLGLGDHVVKRGLVATIISIEIMDLSLSIDNVVAAVALDKRLWVVCLGVFIGILALRFVAGYCITLIERFPILNKTAFLLIGFVGAMLCMELGAEAVGTSFHINSVEKFAGIITITAATLLYGHTDVGRRMLEPVVKVGMPILYGMDAVLGLLMRPFSWIAGSAKWVMNGKPEPTES